VFIAKKVKPLRSRVWKSVMRFFFHNTPDHLMRASRCFGTSSSIHCRNTPLGASTKTPVSLPHMWRMPAVAMMIAVLPSPTSNSNAYHSRNQLSLMAFH
jgi:hypothetical protein